MSKTSKKSTPDLSNALKEFNQFDIQNTIQSIWNEKDLNTKKQRVIDEVIANFKFKEKQMYFTGAVKGCKDHKTVDKILSNIVLYGEGLNSIKV